jgi:hypothetical protein
MFCPTCGRDNPTERKYCATCGTNLEAVSQALSGSEEDFFTKIDTAMDQFIARYAEHVFKHSPSGVLDRRVGKSWRVLGQGVITSFVDLLLFLLMWNILPLRFLLLLISTPLRLLSERGKHRRGAMAELEGSNAAPLSESPPQKWISNSVASVTEQATIVLADSEAPQRNPGLNIRPPK